jgi:hypothetical protein
VLDPQLGEGHCSDRAFDRLPILAIAFQDAGCDNDDILCVVAPVCCWERSRLALQVVGSHNPQPCHRRASCPHAAGTAAVPGALLLRQPLSSEHVVVVLGEAVGFVADVLQEAKGGGVAAEFDRLGVAGAEDLFLLLGE